MTEAAKEASATFYVWKLGQVPFSSGLRCSAPVKGLTL